MRPAGELSLPAYLRDELVDVERYTGKPIYVATGISTFDSEVHVAGPSERVHRLSFNPQYEEYANHFLISAIRKVRRVAGAPASDRYVPATDMRRRLPPDIEADLRARIGAVGEENVRRISRFLYQGTVRQLTSMPVDLRVEREIYDDLPLHRDAQVAYLSRQLGDLVPHFAPEMAEFAPEAVYRPSTAMNVALAIGFGEIAGVEADAVFRESTHYALGETLHVDLADVEAAGVAGDRAAIDAWARRLDIAGWYEWVQHDRT